MIYEFYCERCEAALDVERPMARAGEPADCPRCREPMRRVYGHAFHCDEIRGRTYFDPVKKAEVRGHGQYFDIGMGQWIFSKSDRRKKMKALGLVEHGPRMI